MDGGAGGRGLEGEVEGGDSLVVLAGVEGLESLVQGRKGRVGRLRGGAENDRGGEGGEEA